MARQPLGPRKAWALVATAAMTVSAGLAGAGSAVAQPDGTHPARSIDTASHHQVPVTSKMHGLQRMTGREAVFVQLSGDGAAAVSRHTLRTAPGKASARASEARSAALARRATVKSHAAAALSTAHRADSKAQSLFVVSNAVPGIGIVADRAALRALAQRSDVVKISAIVPKTASNAHTAQLTRVLNAWQDTGQLGDGVTVGIIDTGLDYTHNDFGGNGDYAAAETNASNKFFNWRGAQPEKLQAKVAGGWDFVGDDYNADPTGASGAYQPVPHPDPNPLDCNEHGTHVAGTVGGYGENADGSTFTGDYGNLTADDLDSMKIGPGMAPAAKLYSLKVFGCEGSTDVVIPALDLALDPNGDGNFADHLDIVNLSLGSDYATPDDPENAVIDHLAENGVLPVIAMGNGGDLTDIGGSPGNAVRSLAVASSVDSYQLLSGMKVNAPAGVAGTATGQVSIAYPWTTAPDVRGKVVELQDPANKDGCDPLSDSDAAAVKGNIAWLTWDSDDATRRCGSAGRAGNVKAAGAIGAIFTGDVPVFSAGITGDPDIPVFQLTLSETQRLQSAADAGTLDVTFTKSLVNNQPTDDPSLNDLVSSFSSRGTHGSIGVVKPDVTAPGDTIASAGMGTGDDVLVISGTSMATPHTAGISALVKAAHPDWTPEQLKAAVMNNADHDLYTDANKTGDIYGPARVGAGRVDALSAVQGNVLAYDQDVPGAVSASFGVIEAPINGGTVARSQTVRVQNTGDSDATFDASYAAAVQQPGVSYSVQPSTVVVPAHTTGTVTVTVTVDPTRLRHTIDPTMQAVQSGVPRQFVSDASGRMVLTQQGGAGQVLRVPVYTAAKPVSDMSATAGFHQGQGVVNLTGNGFAEGGDKPTSSDYTSLASVMDFGAESPKLSACADASGTGCTVNQTAEGGDLRYVGAGVSPDANGHLTDGWLWFGLSTYGDSATLGNSTIPYVDFDTTGDGRPDYEVYAQNVAGTDVLVAWLIDLQSGAAIDAEPVNMNFGDVDTNVFDTDAVLIPVWPKLIGITDSTRSFPITYTVGTFSAYTNNPNGDIDDVGPVTFDAANPAVSVDSPLWADVPSAIDVNARRGAKALVLHLHNASGNRAQVLRFAGKVAPRVSLGLTPNPVRHGRTVTATVRIANTAGVAATGKVVLRKGNGKAVARGTVRNGMAKVRFKWKSRHDPRIHAAYAGDSNYRAGRSRAVKLHSR